MKRTSIYIYIFFIHFLFCATYKGQILDSNSDPIYNVNIYTYSSGTSTDKDGYFKIEANTSPMTAPRIWPT